VSNKPPYRGISESRTSLRRFVISAHRTGANSALLLIDHQEGTMGWVRSIPFEDMKRNALMLARTARILKMPVVLTSSMEDEAQGPSTSSAQ
jgi:nicotinamidase-related amidase